MKLFIYVCLVISISLSVQAQGLVDETPSEVADLDEKARKRAYDGGLDEDDLKVVPEFRAPYRVVNIRTIQTKVYEQVLEEVEDEKKENTSDDSSTAETTPAKTQ